MTVPCCCGSELPVDGVPPEDVPSGSGPTRCRRMGNAALLLGCAAALAWLGPEWHVSPTLVVLGTVLLFAFSAAALFSRAVPGALSWRCAPLVLLPGALLLGAVWLPRGESSGSAVVVEVFAPGGLDGDAVRLQSVPESTAAVHVVWDLLREAGRGRLGDLLGLERPLSPEETGKLTGQVWFVNGLPLSRLEPLEDAVRREATRDDAVLVKVEATRLPTYTGHVPASLDLHVTAPGGARFDLLVLQESDRSGPWWRSLRILTPSKESVGEESPDGMEQDLEFWVPAVSAVGSPKPRLLLLVSLDGRLVAAQSLETEDGP